jgi:hypothetical protein
VSATTFKRVCREKFRWTFTRSNLKKYEVVLQQHDVHAKFSGNLSTGLNLKGRLNTWMVPPDKQAASSLLIVNRPNIITVKKSSLFWEGGRVAPLRQ